MKNAVAQAGGMAQVEAVPTSWMHHRVPKRVSSSWTRPCRRTCLESQAGARVDGSEKADVPHLDFAAEKTFTEVSRLDILLVPALQRWISACPNTSDNPGVVRLS